MKNILVIGGGAMGSAFTIPSLENKNNVTITEPHSKRFIKDLSNKKDDKVFVFNGWTFSSSVTLRTFDHPVYDLWVTGCENI